MGRWAGRFPRESAIRCDALLRCTSNTNILSSAQHPSLLTSSIRRLQLAEQSLQFGNIRLNEWLVDAAADDAESGQRDGFDNAAPRHIRETV